MTRKVAWVLLDGVDGTSEGWASLPVAGLRGAGPARRAALARIGITTLGELLDHLPRFYLDRSRIEPVSGLVAGTTATIVATVLRCDLRFARGRRDAVARLEDATGTVQAVWFRQPYVRDRLTPGTRAIMSGRVVAWRGLRFVNPEFEVIGSAGEPGHAPGIVPVYPLAEGLSQRLLRSLVRQAIERLPAVDPDDPVPAETRLDLGLLDRASALRAVHGPRTAVEAEEGRRALAFAELFLTQLLLLALRSRRRSGSRAPLLRGDPARIERTIARLPFRLTGAQERAWSEILTDLSAAPPMMRLLQGDVGSGKTVVAALAALWTATSGAQACFIAPTEILAQQHQRTLASILEPDGVSVAILTGRTGAAEKRRILEDLSRGRTGLIVGTHALLEEDVRFERLGLAVIDEQHRFGVSQRLRLLEKGGHPHTLVMSATPIPRTLAMAFYGDLDITSIDEIPPGRTPVVTRIVGRERWADLLRFISGRCRKGQQAFFIYPIIEESELLDLRDATRMRDAIAADPSFLGLQVALLHGRTPADERESTLRAVAEGRIAALVSTTVVEVGIDLPRATIMVVEHPERFGLSQLHQLRGRIGRAPGETPYCFLVRPPGGMDDAGARLSVLARESDGFRIAEEDLRLRGPGDLTGAAQWGKGLLAGVDLSRDGEMIGSARRWAERFLARDPGCASVETRRLLRISSRRHPEAARMFGVG